MILADALSHLNLIPGEEIKFSVTSPEWALIESQLMHTIIDGWLDEIDDARKRLYRYWKY